MSAAILSALDADRSLLSAITLSDSGVPTLTLTAAQMLTLQDVLALGATVNPSDYAIAVTDTAAAISRNFGALSDVPQISAITLTDPGVPTLTLTDNDLYDGAQLFGEITNATYNVTVDDTASNIANDLDNLNTDPQVTSIVISDSDGAYMDLTVGQVLDDTAALGKIANATYGIVVIDYAATIAANIDALSANGHIAEVATYDGPVPLTVAQAMENRSLLGNGGIGFNGAAVPVPVAIVDTAANVAAALGALNRDPGIVSITLTDAGTPILDLTAAQAANDTTALGEIVGPYTINIVQGSGPVSVADFLADQASLDATGAITISDSSANIAASFDALNADWRVESITSTDNTPLGLTAAQVTGDANALGEITNSGYTIAVADTAAAVSSGIDALNADTHVTSITLTDAGTPTLTLTANQVAHDTAALGEITNSAYAVAVVDTAVNVVENFDALAADANVTSITLTGSTALVLSAAQAVDDQALLGEITNASYSITAVGSGADVSANIDALNADAHVTSIFVADAGSPTPTLTLTAAQALEDTTALGEISEPYAVAISDTAADVAAQLDALNNDGQIASITLTGSAVPTLAVTAAQVQADATALAKIANVPYVLGVTGTGGEIINVGQTLALANFAYDTTNADWQLSGYGLAETLANVAGVVDASGQRFLLVGGGSGYTTAQAAVSAASDGDAILLTPGSNTNVGTDGKAITIEDVSAAGSTPDNVPPRVTITSPSVAGNFGFSDQLIPITGTVIPYGTAIVAGQTVTVTDNGNAAGTATVQANGSFSLYVTLAYEGANALVASATDSRGNTGTSAPVVDTLDDIPPTVTITSAAEISDVATQTITGVVTSGGAATVDGPNVFLDVNGEFLGGTGTVQADGTFSITVTLPDQGANDIVVYANDNYGNISSGVTVVDTLTSSDVGYTLLGTAGGVTLDGSAIPGAIAAYSLDDVTVDLGAGTASQNGSSVSDTLIGIDVVMVSGSADTVIAGTGADTLMAAGNNDTLVGNADGSTLDGSAGVDTVAAYALDNATVDLAAGTASVNGASASDTLVGITAGLVSGSNDTLIAGSGVETLASSGTDDTLVGNAGGSTLDGSAGIGTTAAYALDDVTVDLGAGTAIVTGASAGGHVDRHHGGICARHRRHPDRERRRRYARCERQRRHRDGRHRQRHAAHEQRHQHVLRRRGQRPLRCLVRRRDERARPAAEPDRRFRSGERHHQSRQYRRDVLCAAELHHGHLRVAVVSAGGSGLDRTGDHACGRDGGPAQRRRFRVRADGDGADLRDQRRAVGRRGRRSELHGDAHERRPERPGDAELRPRRHGGRGNRLRAAERQRDVCARGPVGEPHCRYARRQHLREQREPHGHAGLAQRRGRHHRSQQRRGDRHDRQHHAGADLFDLGRAVGRRGRRRSPSR